MQRSCACGHPTPEHREELSSLLRHLVGAGRFERPTPCAQGTGVCCKDLQQSGESAFAQKATPSVGIDAIRTQFWHSLKAAALALPRWSDISDMVTVCWQTPLAGRLNV